MILNNVYGHQVSDSQIIVTNDKTKGGERRMFLWVIMKTVNLSTKYKSIPVEFWHEQ